jgi:hypothetical protein
LVVTPSTIPMLLASRISSRFAVSMKNFMLPSIKALPHKSAGALLLERLAPLKKS